MQSNFLNVFCLVLGSTAAVSLAAIDDKQRDILLFCWGEALADRRCTFDYMKNGNGIHCSLLYCTFYLQAYDTFYCRHRLTVLYSTVQYCTVLITRLFLFIAVLYSTP